MTAESVRTQLKEHHAAAFRWARQCCYYDDELAQEVLQMTYLKTLEGRATWNGNASFRTWLFSVIRYTAIDQLRQTKNFSSLDEVDVATDEELPANRDYREVIRRLPGRQAEVLLLYFYHEMTLEEVADVLQISIGSVRTHYARGKENLKNLLIRENAKYE